MYDRATTDAAIAAASLAMRAAEPDPAKRWDLERHSSSIITASIAHFDAIRDDDGQLTRALTPEESRYIQNERRLCALDFSYYCEYARIIAWDKSSTPFRPNVAQQMVLDLWAQLEARAMPISMQQLKARQLGVSTLTEIAVAHRVQFHERVNAVVASADPQKSKKMARMIGYCWEQMPWWLMPDATTITGGMPSSFGKLNSSLLIQAGNQFTGVARGDTPNVAHLSELCEWVDPEDLVDSALLRAMHETPDLFLVLESTALGRGNWWHKKWKLSKSDWATGRARLCPIFLPWFVGVDLYPTATWLRTRPIPVDWTPADVTLRHAERARAYVLASPLLFQFLAKGDRDWHMPLSQLWYYEVERDAAIKQNTLNKFLQEMPSDDQEAFQTTNVSAIGSEIILEYRERVPPPLGVYTIVGTGVSPEHTISSREWDRSQPPITIRGADVLARNDDAWQLIPLRFLGYPDTDPMLRLFIWEWPETDETYGIGVDTADGLGLDRSVVEVLRKDSPTRIDAQCAEFASDYIKANQLWPMALAISIFYSPFQSRQDRRVPSRCAVECKGNGEAVQHEMKKRGWPNFHPWIRYDNKKPASAATAHKEGVFTNQWFRAQMMDMMLTKIDEQTIDVRSPWLVEEMEVLERDEFKQSLKAGSGEHDDRFMALGFPVFSLHVLDLPGRQYSRRSPSYVGGDPRLTRARSTGQYATYQPPLAAQSATPRRALIPIEQGRRAPGSRQPPRWQLGRYTNHAVPRGFR